MQLRPRASRVLPVSSLVAGAITTLVGVTSSAAIVFQAARALGAGPAEIGSWVLALGVGIGITSITLSLRHRAPVVTAWSTPGAALLAASAQGTSMAEAVGAFLVAAALTVLVGVTGWFEKAVDLIPASIASALLGGVLLRFGLDVFTTMRTQFWLVLAMLVGYLVCKALVPRYAVLAALVAGVAFAAARGTLHFEGVRLATAVPVLTWPDWSAHAVVGIAVPLFVITMTSQNLPGVVTLRAHGYTTPVSPVLSWTGLANLVLAPLGCFGINLAAITAALCMGPDAHRDPGQRYRAAVVSGVFYLLLGVFGAALGSVLGAFPVALVAALAGIGLLDTIGGSLANATADPAGRTAALIAFLVTASGLAPFGIASVFWGLVAGLAAHAISRMSRLRERGTAGDVQLVHSGES
ncbi:benzoate membrane transport protein [Saccharopolyspora erythraea NRRL 2338]|uniref:Benzoate transporter n=2 Tax=Saccharopolyspora erythraea TaxID=1836 RepID=A4FH90_SACEN|nr:benzoate/H(+) symporter BenE family transporter [Saccharopolyspora erythraea]EQD86829.1 membrane protein [Saccharopolyspora erythraea D]AAQ94241.1 transport protein [Saccharopolyspora erythraea]PFG97115.1 benzoate membrane transport protein [Saccharopolyspora erythraea NRRL 2338]QRK87321.1 benzoate/H(+) symporter BenE family transporter [Saccharopolyspora erythraea]CAM03415.1 benzoate transporter [Saccharopolyspora erythraea NRRL 2338]